MTTGMMEAQDLPVQQDLPVLPAHRVPLVIQEEQDLLALPDLRVMMGQSARRAQRGQPEQMEHKARQDFKDQQVRQVQ